MNSKANRSYLSSPMFLRTLFQWGERGEKRHTLIDWWYHDNINNVVCIPIHYNTFFFWYTVVVPLYMYLNDVNKCFCWDRCLFQFSLNKNIVILFVKRDDDTSSKEIQIFSLISKGMKEHLILILTSHIFRSHITWQHFYSPIMQNGVTQKKNTQQCIFIYLFYQSAMKKCLNDLFTRN